MTIELKGKFNKDCKVFCDDVDYQTLGQIQLILDQEVSEGVPVRIQSDTHFGAGVCVGFTMPLTDMLNPRHIGVDISCGMLSGSFSVDNGLDLERIDREIKENIPMGFSINETIKIKNFPFGDVQILANRFIVKYNDKFGTNYNAPTYNEKWLTQKLKDINMDAQKFFLSISSLGGGNHFIEIGKSDTYDNKHWVTIHCGSRQFGLKIAEYWTKVANGKVKTTPKEYTDKLRDIVENTPNKQDIPKRINDLKRDFGLGTNKEYLKGDDMIGYLFDMLFANVYSQLNRATILKTIQNILGVSKFDEVIETVHNFISFDDMIIRKGAIRSYVGEKMIIPFNMKEGLLVCTGLSNPDYNFSAPHGSGRKFSRSEAKSRIGLSDFKKEMDDAGIYTTSVCKSTCDEAPDAYKSSKMIEEYLKNTATILERVKPVLNIKDTGKSVTWREKKALKKKADRERTSNRKAMKKIKGK